MSTMLPEIETERLRLRQFTAGDREAFAALRADPEVMRYIGTGTGQTREEALKSLEYRMSHWHEHGFGNWAVALKDGGALIGWCGIGVLDNTPEIEIGYGFAKEYWGRGLGTEAARAALRFGFEQLGLERLVAVAIPENTGSRRIMEKAGMKYVKDAHFYERDVVYYALTRDEFEPGDAPFKVIPGSLTP